MTSANVFNWTAVNVSQTLNANARASRSKADNPEMASVFASMMNTNYSATSNLSSDVDSKHTSWSTSVNETDSANAYDRYSYREEAIDTVDENPRLLMSLPVLKRTRRGQSQKHLGSVRTRLFRPWKT